MTEPKEPTIGDIVHLIHSGTCYAAIVTAVDDNGTGLNVFAKPNGDPPPSGYEPYNSLHSARPTSGWHWPSEHDD